MFEILPNWHPLLVHFTVALYAASFLFFVLARVFSGRTWAGDCRIAAFSTLWLGAAISVLTVAAGFYAFNTVRHDAPSHAAMTDHRNWALATAALWWVLALWTIRTYRTSLELKSSFIGVFVVAVGLLMTTGWKGGELVYRYGLGVLSLPAVSENNSDQGEPRPENGDDGHESGEEHPHDH
ncbi:MAG: DUF2231 domain-containing protein [Alphaproteobacteria bacterium]|nr:DUF2231 domain-containing protein [Alphaproteobacteria bacterium]